MTALYSCPTIGINVLIVYCIVCLIIIIILRPILEKFDAKLVIDFSGAENDSENSMFLHPCNQWWATS